MSVRNEPATPSQPDASAESILELVRAGDQRQALQILMDAWGALVYRVCCRVTGDASEAYDLRQETFLTVFRALDNYRGDGSPRSFVLGIMSKQLAEHARKRRRERSRKASLAAVALVRDAATSAPNQNQVEKRHALNSCLSKLAPTTRMVVILRHQEGLSGEEVARVLGNDVNAVYQCSSRGVSALRKCLVTAGVRE